MGDEQKDLNLSNKCDECGTNFSSTSNLRRHVKKFHEHKINVLAPRIYKDCAKFGFSCNNCDKNFNDKRNLRYHVLKAHNGERSRITQTPKKCPLCIYKCLSKKAMITHFKDTHEIETMHKELDFSSVGDFLQWKNNMETDTNARFVNKWTTNNIRYYICHRSGNYVPEGKGARYLKTQGTNKINAYCPASINLTKDNAGYKMQFIATHVGHQTDIGHLSLTSLERQALATKIASKVPFDAILDEVRDSICDSNLKRIHLLTRKDLYNIESCFNLASSAVRHHNDAISVESWVNEMKRDGECVLFYKPQALVLEEYPQLKSDDFLLVIMTPAQCDFLKKYGSDCVCLDGTHGLNSYNFELNTLLVLDDLREGFPCAFLISNRSDKEVLSIFFSQIKIQTGLITPKVFMSDLADSFFNAWLEVMGTPERRLFCTWHVDRAWRKNLNKIKSKEKQVDIYKQLRTILEERDSVAFEKMIERFCSLSNNPETIDFLKYFTDNYLRNRQNWAYCFRLHAGINTNMHLERMHKTIKYIYLKGKNVKRLDKAISAIMRFVRDKLIDRLIVKNKGKICSKLKDIRSRHKNMLSLDLSSIIPVEHGWKIQSTNQNEMYFIQDLNKTCHCQLICTDCKICIHQYSCSCMDSSIKFNMCKHIHLTATFRNYKEAPNEEQSNIAAAEDRYEHADDSECIVTELSKNKQEKSTLEEEKNRIRNRFLQHLDSINSPTKLAVVKNIIAPLSPTLAAVEKTKSSFPSSSKTTAPHNEKISAQRRLWSTRKKKKNKHLITKPSVEETLNLAATLLTE